MKNIFVGILLLAVSQTAMSYTWVDNNASHPDHPDKCYIEEYKYLFSPGESYFPAENCVRMDCNGPKTISGYGCGTMSIEGCKQLDHDYTKQYPECCWAKCVEWEDGNENAI